MKKITLKEICLLVTDGTHDSPAIVDSGMPLIKAKEISKGNIDFENCDFISIEDYNEVIKRVKPQKNDILFSNIGASIGDIARVEDDRDFAIKNVALFRPNPEKVNVDFFNYFVNSSSFKAGILNYQAGSAQPYITLEVFRSYKFYLKIDLPYQTYIAQILSPYDALINVNRRRIQLLEEAAQLLFREWFVYFRFPLRRSLSRAWSRGSGQAGHEKACPVESINSTGVKIVDGVPEGWKKCLLGDFAEIRKGKNITFEQAIEGDIPVVGGGLGPTYYHNKANVSSPVITISASGANAGHVNLYDTDIWASDCSYINKNSTKYIFSLYLRLKSLQTAIFGYQVGAAQPHVYPKDLNRLKLLIATDDLCLQFEQLIEPMFNLIKSLKLENEKLAQVRDLLLPRLMSGAIEV